MLSLKMAGLFLIEVHGFDHHYAAFYSAIDCPGIIRETNILDQRTSLEVLVAAIDFQIFCQQHTIPFHEHIAMTLLYYDFIVHDICFIGHKGTIILP